MNVHPRHRRLDRPADAEIGGAGVVGVDAALQADLGGAALPCLARRGARFPRRQIVRRAAQFLAALALGEGAELAAIIADVGIVDIAVDDVADPCRRDPPPIVGGGAHAAKAVAARRETVAYDLGLRQGFAGARFVDNRTESAIQRA